MPSALPHSTVIATHLEDYLSDVQDAFEQAITNLPSSPHFRGIFKSSLAAHCALGSFAPDELLLIRVAAGIARRIPLLLAARQVSLCYVELRRFVDVVAWYPYFREHPVEWEEFQRNPTTAYVRETDRPIAFSAHREVGWFFGYIRERFASEASGLVVEATDQISTPFGELSSHVHAAVGGTTGDLASPLDTVSPTILKAFQKTQRKILAAGTLIISGSRPNSLDLLPAVERAYFDWLIGSEWAKHIKAGPFGIDSL